MPACSLGNAWRALRPGSTATDCVTRRGADSEGDQPPCHSPPASVSGLSVRAERAALAQLLRWWLPLELRNTGLLTDDLVFVPGYVRVH